jgi:serine protease AprX
VLSIMSGYLPGKIMGPAYNSDFLLARTEEIESSNCISEDIWISAIEWADSLGSEIILSSAGIMLEQMFSTNSFQNNSDNKRNPLYKVLKIAANRGILFVSDAPANYNESIMWDIKNSGIDMLIVQSANESWENLDLNKRFSGWEVSTYYDNPTGKHLILDSIESDLYAAEAGGENFYGWRKGSSYLAALTAASASVIMEAHPDWNPAQVLEAIRSSNVEKEEEGQIIGSKDAFLNIFNAINAVFPQASGDLDGNGRIDGNDLALFSEYYLKKITDDLHKSKAADLDGNLIIDGNDLAILARKFATN